MRTYVFKVTLEMSHSHIEESEQRIDMNLTGEAAAGSDAAHVLGEGAADMLNGSSMQPGMAIEVPQKGKGKGRGKGNGQNKGEEKGRGKKKDEPCFARSSSVCIINFSCAGTMSCCRLHMCSACHASGHT